MMYTCLSKFRQMCVIASFNQFVNRKVFLLTSINSSVLPDINDIKAWCELIQNRPLLRVLVELIQLSYKRISRRSGIQEIFACEIQNPGIWNAEFSRGICNTAIEWNLESKFHCNTRNPESFACDPESTVWNSWSEFETVLNYLTRGDTVGFCILSTLNLTNQYSQIS